MLQLIVKFDNATSKQVSILEKAGFIVDKVEISQEENRTDELEKSTLLNGEIFISSSKAGEFANVLKRIAWKATK